MTSSKKPAALPWDAARWPNFARAEIACPCCGQLVIRESALDALQKLRGLMAEPLTLNSAHRCVKHNRKVGGAPQSRHLMGDAFDIAVGNHDRRKLYWSAQIAGFTGFGFMRNALHVDKRSERAAWNYGPQSLDAWAGILPPGTPIVRLK